MWISWLSRHYWFNHVIFSLDSNFSKPLIISWIFRFSFLYFLRKSLTMCFFSFERNFSKLTFKIFSGMMHWKYFNFRDIGITGSFGNRREIGDYFLQSERFKFLFSTQILPQEGVIASRKLEHGSWNQAQLAQMECVIYPT